MYRPRWLIWLIAGICLASVVIWLAWPVSVHEIRNFGDAKRILEKEIYFDHRLTIYCNAPFDENKAVTLPDGFIISAYADRANRVEWEHAVPAEHFGQTFKEWREGDPSCIRNGVHYKGRKCAEKASAEYRKMDTDLYNLFPAIGSVNARRKNYDYGILPDAEASFGSCQVKTGHGQFEPPESARGQLARASLYMADEYPRYKLGDKQRKLFLAWDRIYPVDQWECTRARRIEKIQGRPNKFVRDPCKKAALW